MENVTECPGGSSVFLQLINTLLVAQCVQDPAHDYQPNYSANIRDKAFDFVIIGGGTAGSVLARRLSEDPNTQVLLLEAGGYPTSDTEVPALWLYGQKGPATNQFVIAPSDYACKGFKEERCLYQRGKMLGGSSALSLHRYVRGNKKNYNDWGSSGNPGWNWSEALRYFKKSEDCTSKKYDNGLHGTGGPLKTSDSKAETNYRELYFKAAEEAGYEIRDDESLDGFFEVLATYNQGKAESAAQAYLKPIKTRDNLKVALYSYATKIVIEDFKATGVEVVIDGDGPFLVKASKEVIVSAGVINSPQLLLLSGIGPKEDLEKFCIEVVADLPVGRNFQDHIQNWGLWVSMNTTLDPIVTDKDNLETYYEYCVNHTGALSYLETFNILRYFSTEDEKYPNIQTSYWHATKGDINRYTGFLSTLNINQETIDSIIQALKDHDLINITPTLLTPKSRGTITLQSTSPFDLPVINGSYLTEPDDVQALIAAIRDVQHFIAQPSMQKNGATLLQLQISNCQSEFDSDDYWECAIRNLASTAFDGSGTCRMGPDGVVDETLKVRGIKALRVIDASIMPEIPAANLDAPTIMVAEKGADLIKRDWNM